MWGAARAIADPADTIGCPTADHYPCDVGNAVPDPERCSKKDALQSFQSQRERDQARTHAELKQLMSRGQTKTERDERKTAQVDNRIAERYPSDGVFQGIGWIDGKIHDDSRR